MKNQTLENQITLFRQLLVSDSGIRQAEEIERTIRLQNPNTKFPSLFTELILKGFIGTSEIVGKIKDETRILALENDSVLVQGETGTGKEIIAKALHGPRKGKFIPINCTSLPDYLLESELFGHVKGAFTGAISEKEGILSCANDGTIFLDEIGDMPIILQAKILQAIQNKKIRKVGSNIEETISCRFVSATNQDIKELLEKKLFRLDLFYRLSTFEIYIPPLNIRKGDMEVISLYYGADEKCLKYILSLESLPGNVRQIQKIIRQYQILDRLG